MPEESGGEKTLPPSPTKRRKAREQGNVAKSQDLNSAWTLLTALLALHFVGPQTFRQLLASVEHFYGDAYALVVAPHTAQALLASTLIYMARCLLPFMVVLMIAGIAINLVQFGVIFAPQAVAPKLAKLNPISGFKKFASVRTFVELVKSVFKLVIVCAIVWVTVRNRWHELLVLMHLAPLDAVRGVAGIVVAVWWRVAMAMLLLGMLDYAFQRWQHDRELRMTVQEAREELRQLEGDPRIKQRIRQIQRRIAMQRMMAEVPTADVIITNPTAYAVALRYDVGEMDAPTVVAKGARRMAERIRDIAVEHDVPIVEKPELARALWRTVEVGQPVPENLFRTVAEVLAFVYRIDRRADKIRERAPMMVAQHAV